MNKKIQLTFFAISLLVFMFCGCASTSVTSEDVGHVSDTEIIITDNPLKDEFPIFSTNREKFEYEILIGLRERPPEIKEPTPEPPFPKKIVKNIFGKNIELTLDSYYEEKVTYENGDTSYTFVCIEDQLILRRISNQVPFGSGKYEKAEISAEYAYAEISKMVDITGYELSYYYYNSSSCLHYFSFSYMVNGYATADIVSIQITDNWEIKGYSFSQVDFSNIPIPEFDFEKVKVAVEKYVKERFNTDKTYTTGFTAEYSLDFKQGKVVMRALCEPDVYRKTDDFYLPYYGFMGFYDFETDIFQDYDELSGYITENTP